MRANPVEVTDELINVCGNLYLARPDVLIDTALALLPFPRPEPSLVGRHWDLRAKLDYSVVTLHHLNLRTGSVELMAPPKIGRKHDLATRSHTYE